MSASVMGERFVATQLSLTASHLRLAGIVVVVVLVLFVGIRQILHARDLKRRKAASVGYHDRDVAHYGVGPAGFAGAASARTADGTPLAPSFGPGGPTTPPVKRGLAPQSAGAPRPAPAATPTTLGTPAVPAQSPIGPAARPRVPAAGWLPDPSGDPTLLRYWDGSNWTPHTARSSSARSSSA